MERQVKFCGPQKISAASLQNTIATFLWTTEINGDLKKQTAKTSLASFSLARRTYEVNASCIHFQLA